VQQIRTGRLDKSDLIGDRREVRSQQ